MKVVLLQDIPNLGKKYEVKEVADGYARNFLLPKKLVKIATVQVLKELAVKKEKIERERKERINQLENLAKEIFGQKLEFKLKINEKGEVFGSITKLDIKKALQEKGITEAEIKLEHPLKKIGEHQVEINLGEGIKTMIKVVINKE